MWAPITRVAYTNTELDLLCYVDPDPDPVYPLPQLLLSLKQQVQSLYDMLQIRTRFRQNSGAHRSQAPRAEDLLRAAHGCRVAHLPAVYVELTVELLPNRVSWNRRHGGCRLSNAGPITMASKHILFITLCYNDIWRVAHITPAGTSDGIFLPRKYGSNDGPACVYY